MTFEEWAAKTDDLRIYLVETSVKRVSDGAIIPLYLADYPPDNLSRYYVPQIKALPRLTRQSSDTQSPNHVPTWGDLTLRVEFDYKPDPENSLTWRELLSPAYDFCGQPLVIKGGGEDFAEEDYFTLFTGHIGYPSWDEGAGTITLRLYDMGRDLETKIPDCQLPESPFVDEVSWGQTVPLPLGPVNNYKPVLIRLISGEGLLYALAPAVISAVRTVYVNGEAVPSGYFIFEPRDVSPAGKEGESQATLETFGPYSGGAVQQKWLLAIESITAGPEVGLARFRWSRDDGRTWEGEGLLTWKLAYDATTLAKNPAVGNATLTVSGAYTGETKRTYKVKVKTAGHIGGSITPQFVWSDDDGATWSAPVNIYSTSPIALNRGLSVAFTGSSPYWVVNNYWNQVSGTGSMTVVAYNPGNNVLVEITTGGQVGVDAPEFKWSNNGGTSWNTGVGIPNSDPIILFAGYEVSFSGILGVGDNGGTTSTELEPFIVDDMWSWGFKEVPIPLGDGVSVQFHSQTGQDFYVGDTYSFQLISTILLAHTGAAATVTADVDGILSPVDLAYVSRAADLIRALASAWCGWDPDDNFDLTALAAFNTAFPYALARLVDSPTAVKEVIDKLLTGLPAIYSLAGRKFYLKEIVPPTGTPALILTETEVLPSLQGEKNNSNYYRGVYLNYDRNNNVMQNPTGVTQERLEWLTREYREYSKRNLNLIGVQECFDLGPLDTCLVNRADAMDLADRLLARFGSRLENRKPEIKAQALLLNIMDTVDLKGELFNLMGLELDYYDRSRLTLER